MLSDNEQSAFEHYFRQGGGFVGIHCGDRHRARTGRSWTSLLGTRAEPAPPAPARAPGSRRRRRPRSRSPTACTTRASRWPSASTVTDSFYNATSDVRGFQHVLATVDEDTYEEQDATPTRTDDHPVMWCQDLEGGRAFYTGLGHNAATFANTNVAGTSRAPSSGPPACRTRRTATAARPCSRTTSRSRSRRRRTSTSRSASTSSPTGASSRPRAPARSACTTPRAAPPRCSRTWPSSRRACTRTARTASTARPWTPTSRRTSGCTSTTRRRS